MSNKIYNLRNINIGIITFHSAHNYGAMLQAYALQTVLKKLTAGKVKIIDFRTSQHLNAYKVIKLPKNWYQAKFTFIRSLHYYLLRKKWNAFEKFYSNFLDKTHRFNTYEELDKSPLDFDVIISGSDQVFNPGKEYSEAYYLKFCNKSEHILVAYAPSFGCDNIPVEKVEMVKHLLARFDLLSSRELQGCIIIKNLTGKTVNHVLDPVFLLLPNEWNNIAVPVRNLFTKYILVYALSGVKKQMEMANKIKKYLKLPIVLITNNVYPKTNADKVVYSSGPQEFVYLFSNAGYIVTDSFHGTAFSLIFEKPFFSIIMLPQKASRIISLLESVGLEKRVLIDVKDIVSEELEVNYKIVSKLLKKEKLKSINYLEQVLILNKEV